MLKGKDIYTFVRFGGLDLKNQKGEELLVSTLKTIVKYSLIKKYKICTT